MDNSEENKQLIKIVKSILKRYNLTRVADYEDYFYEGILEGIKAIQNYENDKNTKLSTYIYLRVNYKIMGIFRAKKAKKRNSGKNIYWENTFLEETGALFNYEVLEENKIEEKILEEEFNKEFHDLLKEILNDEDYNYMKLFLEGNSIDTISKIMNVDKKKVSNKLYYAKQILRKNKYKFAKIKKIL